MKQVGPQEIQAVAIKQGSEYVCADLEEHAVEDGGAGTGDAGTGDAGEPARGAEGVGQAEHAGADDGHDDVPQHLRGRGAPRLQQRHLHFRRHG